MVTRWKRVAGIAGRIAAPPCKKFAGGLFPPVSSARLWACPQVWMSRGVMAMPEELEVPKCAHVGAGYASSIPPATHTPVAGLAGLWLTHVCVNACVCLEGWLCAGCFQAALWMFILCLIYSREGVVLQMGFAEGPKNGLISFFLLHRWTSLSVSLGPGR